MPRFKDLNFRAILSVLFILCGFTSVSDAAFTTNWDGTTLTINHSTGDATSITVVLNQVKVNGADPTGGPVDPALVQAIVFDGSGGVDISDLSEVTLANGFVHAALDNPTHPNQSIQVDLKGGDDISTGTEFADRLQGKGGADKLWGMGGNDRLDGHFNDNPNADSDEIHGGPGDDTIYGYSGDDFLYGDAGVDSIFGGNDSDVIYGGDDGDQILRGGPQSADVGAVDGADIIHGGPGDDLNIQGDNGDDFLYGDAGNDSIQGNADHDEIHGGDDNDTLNGGGGNDTLYGDDGVDTVDGDGGNDEIHGGDGDDNMIGDNGSDDIYPGAGSDTVFGTPDNNNDTIYITAPAAGEIDTIDGGTEAAGDTLVYDALGNSITGGDTTPAGSITGVGIGTVNYVDIEFINLSNVPLPVINLTLDVSRGADLLLMPTDGVEDGFGQVTVSNSGLVDLSISAITIENNVGSFFSFAGGPTATPTTVTIGAGTSPTLALGILFDASGTDTTATLKILSNTGGGSDVETTVALIGTAFSTLVWDAEATTDFATATNWNPNAAADFLTDYRTELVVDGSAPSAAISNGQIRLGVTGERLGKLSVSGGTLETTGTTPHLRVDGPGRVDQSGGTINIAGNLRLGWDGSDVFPAHYTMSDGLLNINNGEVGRANNSFGRLEMTGGTVNTNINFWVAFHPNTKGEVDITGGQLNAAQMQVGQQGDGSLSISGNAEVNLVNALIFGNAVGAVGSFAMNSGTLNTGAIRVGDGSVGSWSWTGGSISASVEASLPGETLSNDGGTLIVGGSNGVSALAVNDTDYSQGSTGIMEIEVDGTSALSDSVNLTTGSATLDGTIDVSLFGPALISTTSFDIVTATAGGTITYGSGLVINLPGPDWSLTQAADKLTVTFTTIQDPLSTRSWLLYN